MLAGPRSLVERRDNSRARNLLWIDDEISAQNADVRLLELRGFRIDCAATGACGVAMAASARHDAILLDLRLPDVSGLAVLAKIRGAGIETPVLVLTGFGDFESARIAGRLGAAGFRAKPIFIDELLTAVDGLLGKLSSPGGCDEDLDVSEPVRLESTCLAGLLQSLHWFTKSATREFQLPSPSSGNEIPENARVTKRSLQAALIRALANPALPMLTFLVCADLYRRTVHSDPSDLKALVASAETTIVGSFAKGSTDPRVQAAIAAIAAAVSSRRRPNEEEIARAVHIDRSHLGRLIHTATGVTFREWRTGFCIKTAVSHLVSSQEHVGQIACHILGYNHESQFDREFRAMIGLAPREFRRQWEMFRQTTVL